MQLALNLGKIDPGGTIPNPPDPSNYVAGFIRNSISLLILVSFIIMLLFTIIAGIRFITSGSDEKAVSASWKQIYLGMIGMLVVVGSYSIIRLVETFFGVNIISGGFVLPTP